MRQTSTPSRSSASIFAFALQMWGRRELIWQFTVRNIELRHKGSYLGFVWSLLNPLLMLSLYVFVFGYVFQSKFNVLRNETKIDYALGIFLGLTIFQVFAEVLAVAPIVIVSNPNFVKRVVFPLEILPVASVGASLFHTLIALCMALVGTALFGPGLSLNVLWLPLILAPVVFLALGMAWFFAAIGVFFRDISQLVSFFSMALMYASAIVYPLSLVPPAAWRFLRFNPILLAVELSRNAVLWDRPMNFTHLAYLMCLGAGACVVGLWSFRKMSPAFADVL
jgi:lipopolysaccharide transport system permease protein